MNKKILIISRAFPPKGGGGIQRMVKFSVYLEQLGWDVTVCTIKGANFSWTDESRIKELDKVKIIRITEDVYKSSLFNKVKSRLKFHDFYNDWANDVVTYFSNKEDFEYDYVLTSGPPHSVHNIGINLKKKFNFFWISDFRDQYTLGPTYRPVTFLHRKHNQKLEQKIYSLSDLIITNTEVNRIESSEVFKIEPSSKVVSIYNGYDFEDLKETGFIPEFDKEKINLLYLGGLRGDHIDGYFYKMLKIALVKKPNLLNNIVINLVGDLSRKGDLIEKLELGKFFKPYNAVSYDKVGDYIKASDGCLTWQHPNNGYRGTIAGKVFDYFGFKKPIFSLGQTKSELDTIINGHNIGVHTDVNNLSNSANDFIKFIDNLKSYSENYNDLSYDYYDSFNRRTQVNVLNEILIKTFK
ncbi:glycosyltransferase family 4 protein [Aureibaculum algae]|uniref:Glycosyltransferase family 4 protein n=1 Tax=Aureibaculum algae TaxID=2584122 RepID=A0A5B7TPE4_9FLAO|nr:glycosyltransferase family 4 protein [Aureibaculum algae]QCX38819.1 glycosyltransferase family 4 protein [Aureibaculum algae]